VHGKHSLLSKMPGDDWQSSPNLRLLYGFMYGHPGKKLLFMSSEFGQWNEWNSQQSVDWHLLEYPNHRGLQRWLRDLNHVYRTPALDARSRRRALGLRVARRERRQQRRRRVHAPRADTRDETLFITNFTPVPREGYRLGLPSEASAGRCS